jgi:hypothetical protein
LPPNSASGKLYYVLAPSSSPWVLRVHPAAADGDWWRAARLRRDTPAPISALMHGRARVEVSPDEANQAIEWAARVDGWSTASPKPLFIHQPDSIDLS